MTTIEFNLLDFPGFYESSISPFEHLYSDEDELETVNIEASYKNIASHWLDNYIDVCEEPLKNAGIALEFVKVDSPRFYNYSTDKCVVRASFDVDKLKTYILGRLEDPDHYKEFQTILKDRHESRSGFVSFYSYNIHTWLNEYIDEIDVNNVIFESFLIFLVWDHYDYDEMLNKTLDLISEKIEYHVH